MSNDDKKKDLWFRRVIEGRLLTGAFFVRHWLQIVAILAMILLYITNRYSCQQSMEHIRTLNNRLSVVQTESYRIRGEYMSKIRESEMRQRLDTLGLDLSVGQEPPYHIDK